MDRRLDELPPRVHRSAGCRVSAGSRDVLAQRKAQRQGTAAAKTTTARTPSKSVRATLWRKRRMGVNRPEGQCVRLPGEPRRLIYQGMHLPATFSYHHGTHFALEKGSSMSYRNLQPDSPSWEPPSPVATRRKAPPAVQAFDPIRMQAYIRRNFSHTQPHWRPGQGDRSGGRWHPVGVMYTESATGFRRRC